MSTMDEDLRRDILKRLNDDFDLKVSHDGKWLQEGRCPGCAKKELFGSALSPWRVQCGRKNKCGWEGFVKDLYDDLFQSWSDRYPATEKSPTAAADAYLINSRGFEIGRLKGCYRQEWYHDRDLNIGTATVRFTIDGGGQWERLIDRPSRFGKKKARMLPGTSYRGYAWIPPATLIDISVVSELWIVEGIFDAIALCLAGIPAIAAMSCNNYPNATLERLFPEGSKRPKLVWALDGDAAGLEYIARWHARAKQDGWKSGAAVIPQAYEDRKIDWNEAFQRFRLEPANLDEYRHEGALVVAESVAEKARLIYKHRAYKAFPIEFGEQLYWFALNEARFDKAWQALAEKADEMTEEERRDEAIKRPARSSAFRPVTQWRSISSATR